MRYLFAKGKNIERKQIVDKVKSDHSEHLRYLYSLRRA